MFFGLQYSLCVLLVTLIVLSAQGDALPMQSGKVAWTNCGTENDIMKINSVLLNPKPIQSGHKFNFTTKIFLSEKVTGGSINLTMKWSVNPGQVIITLVKETLDLCDLMVDMGVSCPISVGTHILQYHDMIPNIFPKGLYQVQVAGNTQTTKSIFCVQTNYIHNKNTTTSHQHKIAMHGFRFSVRGLLMTAIVLSVQGDTLQLQSDNQIHWTNCGTKNDIVKIRSIIVDPNPIKLGHKYDIYFDSFLSEMVTEGSLNVTLNWLVKPGQIFPVIKETLDLCDQMVELNDSCPLLIGNHIEHYSGYFPKVFPKGFYQVGLAAKSKKTILCMQTNMTIS